jgi:peroxiredoxin
MLPREKALVKRLEKEPFALIGINTDKDPGEYKKQASDQGVTWRSAWDGSTHGPLCTAWGVSSFPTIYVLDAQGTIRYVGARNEKLDEAVEALLAEAKSGPGASGEKPSPGAKPAGDPKPSIDGLEIPVGLSIGRRAPDFTTKDVDGVEFKLSDYRGKVVVLDFWGFW